MAYRFGGWSWLWVLEGSCLLLNYSERAQEHQGKQSPACTENHGGSQIAIAIGTAYEYGGGGDPGESKEQGGKNWSAAREKG
jgi:hypothetical protein